MNKIILLIFFLFSSAVFSQSKITAKYNIDLADSIAHTFASDALLLLVQSADVDSNGLSGQWQYVYASFLENKEYHFVVNAVSAIHQETLQMRVGIGVIRINWIDSDSALTVIKNNGGRNMMWLHPNCTIEATLIRYVAPPFDTYWSVEFKSDDSTFTLLQNAETGEIVTSLTDKEEVIKNNFVLYQNYPNPFNPLTTITYSIYEASPVVIKLYDVNGEEMKTLWNGFQSSGLHKIQFDGKDCSSGIYYCRVYSRGRSQAIKILLLK